MVKDKQTKRVNIWLSDDIHTAAKVISVLQDITLNEYFQKAIEDAIKKDKSILDRIKNIKT